MIKYENNPVGWQGEGLGGRERRGGRWGVVRWNSGTKGQEENKRIVVSKIIFLQFSFFGSVSGLCYVLEHNFLHFN